MNIPAPFVSMPEVWQGWLSDIEKSKQFTRPLPLLDYRRIPKDYIPAEIVEIVARQAGVSVEGVMSHSRLRKFAYPRHVSWLLIRQHCNRKLSEIARMFGRDRSSVEQTLRGFSFKAERHSELAELRWRCEEALR